MDKFYEEPENYAQEMQEDSYNEQEEQYIGEKPTDYTLPKGLQTIPDKKKMMFLTVFFICNSYYSCNFKPLRHNFKGSSKYYHPSGRSTYYWCVLLS